MPVTATLLGSAVGSGIDLDVPISVAQPAGSLVQVFSVAWTAAAQFPEFQGYRSAPTDDAGGTWSLALPHPSVGNTGESVGPLGDKLTGNIVSGTRTGGSPLAGGGSGPGPRPGCTTCGSMLTGTASSSGGGGGTGSTVSVHWFDNSPYNPTTTIAFVIAFGGVVDHFETSNQSQYGNGDTYPGLGANPSQLNWATDIGPGFVPQAAADCAGITLASGYGATGWAPVNGSVVTEVTSGTVSLALSMDSAVAAATNWEPGGSFTTGGSILLGNYQFIRKV